MLSIYLDACCFNRPFDNQNYDRIRFESEAITIIFKHVRQKNVQIIGSDVLKFEINNITNVDKKIKIRILMINIAKNIKLTEKIKERALILENYGFKGFDALHISSAEYASVDIFLTTDDKLIKLYEKNKNNINIPISNPILWIPELLEL